MALCLWLTLISALIQEVICQWSVTMPKSIMGVEGSCVSVPCSFKISNEYEAHLKNCSGGTAVWQRGEVHSPRVRPGDLVGDLTQKNCTTVFQNFTNKENDAYFFRLDCKNPLQFSFKEEVRIAVQPGVMLPQLTSVKQVTEGGQVTLQCVAMVPCPFLPPSIRWTAPQSKTQEQSQMTQSSDGQMMLRSILTFRASAQHHNQTVTCSMSYPLSAGGSTEAFTSSHILNVLYGPRSTLAELSVSGPVSKGRLVVLSCSSEGNPPVTTYTWFSNTNGTAVKVGEGQMLPLQVRQAHSGLYQCEARSKRGAQWSNTLVLEVHSHSEKGVEASVVLWISVLCAVLSALCIFTVALLCYKYKSLSIKLKHLEQREENIYSNLQKSTITSDYESLKPHQTTEEPTSETLTYENALTLRKNFK